MRQAPIRLVVDLRGRLDPAPEGDLDPRPHYGVEVHVDDAGFAYLLASEVRTSADGWEWTALKESSASEAFASDVVVRDDRMVAVGTARRRPGRRRRADRLAREHANPSPNPSLE